tara:strand:+ start:953 stop:1477 length:525 start_codon:yes stop_codon:yes gene_type:complete
MNKNTLNLVLPKKKRGRPKKELSNLLSRYTKQTTTDIEKLPEWLLPESTDSIDSIDRYGGTTTEEKQEEEWNTYVDEGDGVERELTIKRFYSDKSKRQGLYSDSDGNVYDANPALTEDYNEVGVIEDGELIEEDYGSDEEGGGEALPSDYYTKLQARLNSMVTKINHDSDSDDE